MYKLEALEQGYRTRFHKGFMEQGSSKYPVQNNDGYQFLTTVD